MVYTLLKYITKIPLLTYYRKIYIHVSEKLPTDRPLIIASNHPNAFTEPLILTCFFSRRFHFITRSDVFVKKYKKFFDWTHQIPIYRFRDGYHTLKNNKKTFDACHDVLNNDGAILIFSEGSTQLGKSVRPLQKGTAKLALSYLDKYPNSDLSIIPFGYTYSKPINWNGEIFLNTGPILQVKDIIGDQDDMHQNIKAINRVVFGEIQKLALHVEDKDDEEMIEGIANLTRKSSDHSFKVKWDNYQLFKKEQDQLNFITSIKSKIDPLWSSYRDLLTANNLSNEYNPSSNLPILKCLLFLFFTPLALVGLLIGAIPILFTKSYVGKIKNVIMRSGTWIGLNMGLSVALILFLSLVCVFNCGVMGLWLIPVITLLLFIGIRWLSFSFQLVNRLRFLLLSSDIKQELFNAQSQLIASVDYRLHRDSS